jgi:hypothetical protein
MGSSRGADSLHALPLVSFEREMTFLVLLAAATPAGGIPSELACPRGAGRTRARERRCPQRRAPDRGGGRVRIPVHLGDPSASRRIGGLELLVLGGGQVPPQVFNGGAELNEDVVGQGALLVPQRQGVEGVREHVQCPCVPVLRQIIGP